MRQYKIRTEQRFAISEEHMRHILGKRAEILDSEDDKEVEWQILTDTDTARDLNLLGALTAEGLRIQIQAVRVDEEAPDEELDAEDVAAVAEEESGWEGSVQQQALGEPQGTGS